MGQWVYAFGEFYAKLLEIVKAVAVLWWGVFFWRYAKAKNVNGPKNFTSPNRKSWHSSPKRKTLRNYRFPELREPFLSFNRSKVQLWYLVQNQSWRQGKTHYYGDSVPCISSRNSDSLWIWWPAFHNRRLRKHQANWHPLQRSRIRDNKLR